MVNIYPPDITEFTTFLTSYLAPNEIAQVVNAYNYAANAHKDQQRRSGEPYIIHPLAVAKILANLKMDHECLMAALLHDVVEDTIITFDNLIHEFGETVASLVKGVTKLTSIDFPTKAIEQAENFQKMALAMVRDARVILIKLADRLHNMRTLGSLPSHKARRIAKETLEIYAPIANRLGLHDMYLEFEDLGFSVIYPLRAKRLAAAVNSVRAHHKNIIDTSTKQLIKVLARLGSNVQVNGREKHLYSIYSKIRDKQQTFRQIMDIYAIRVVVDSIDNCYLALGIVHSLYKPLPGKFKDHIAIPKLNGYQSLHTTLLVSSEVNIEVQIRTQEMDFMARNGIVSHWQQKPNLPLQTSNLKATTWMQRVLDLQQSTNNSLEFIESIKHDLVRDAIYVFTPQGKIIELPRGATAVDFAYMLHSDIGDTCVACRINRNPAPLSQQLHSGEKVEIITAPGAKPNPKWIDFVKTARAKTYINHVINKQKRDQAIVLGTQLLNYELFKFDTSLDYINQLHIDNLLENIGLSKINDFNELLELIGKGVALPYRVASKLCNHKKPHNNIDPVVISNTDSLVIEFADCCFPIPGDLIAGELLKDKGLVVHASDCTTLNYEHQKNETKNRLFSLIWDKNLNSKFKVKLQIELANNSKTIAQVNQLLHAEKAEIESLNKEHADFKVVVFSILINVSNRMHLVRILKKLRLLHNVTKITRIKY